MRSVVVFVAFLAILVSTPAHARSGRHLSQVSGGGMDQGTGTTSSTLLPSSTTGGGATSTGGMNQGATTTMPSTTTGGAATSTGGAPQGPAGQAAEVPPQQRLVVAPAAEEQRTVPNWLTLWSIVQQQANLNMGSMNALLQQSGLFQILDDPTQSFTLFSPTDDAWMRSLASIPNTDLQGLLRNIQRAVPILSSHIVQGKFTSRDLTDGQMLTTLNPNNMLLVIKNESGVYVKPSAGNKPPAQIIFADTLGSNGYLDVIDRVLLWPGDEEALANAAPAAEGLPPIASFVAGGFAPVSEVGVVGPTTTPGMAGTAPATGAGTTGTTSTGTSSSLLGGGNTGGSSLGTTGGAGTTTGGTTTGGSSP